MMCVAGSGVALTGVGVSRVALVGFDAVRPPGRAASLAAAVGAVAVLVGVALAELALAGFVGGATVAAGARVC
jgi:hypothetical protein